MQLPERNVKRAERIERMSIAYQETIGEVAEPMNYLIMAGVLADMRHWCDLHDVAFDAVVRASHDHWAQEQGEDGE